MTEAPTPNAPHNGLSADSDSAPRTANPLSHPVIRDLQEPRRPSIQFKTHSAVTLPTSRPKEGRVKRRLSSPPPPPVFQPRVSFDTFDRTADSIEENSFTLIAKHKDYEYTKRSRTFLCGCDDNDYSDYALQWLIDELVDDGDEIVCLRVVEKLDTGSGDRNAENARYRSEAHALMKQFQAKNHENKAINLILEFAVGKVNKVIDEMINLYEPAILVVGTKGRNLGGFQGLLPGSVSKYCLQSSPVPVIVVLPSSKRDKSRVKRAQDPNRQGYKDLLEKSGPQAGYTLTASSRNSLVLPDDTRSASRPSSRGESPVIHEATGNNKPIDASPLAQVEAASESVGNRSEADPEEPRSPGVIMKSPQLQSLESPVMSDSSSSEGEEQEERGHNTSAVEKQLGASSGSVTDSASTSTDTVETKDEPAETKVSNGS